MTTTIAAVTFDCTDAAELAGFWAAVLGSTADTSAGEGYASVAGTPGLAFYSVPEAKTVKNRVHLDLGAADLAAEVDRIVGLGAKHVADFDEHGFRWATLTDPEGNEFDVVAL